ncbi:salicylate synthase [Nocardia aurantia]|uniref:Salicylate synthase n=1 Tax=Nocardia aurantia TaxID=2585199 RepID=A0A7K0E0Z5_9NOCA|nr:salicylate synthase [Nocardia aurantia]MQY31739.1 Salicylate synthase [Nocardia aurantia]
MTAPQSLRLQTTLDPVTAVSRLAESGRFGDHVVYERPGTWVFAAAPLGRVELDTDEVRVDAAGQLTRESWTGRPVVALERALDSLRVVSGAGASGTAYGWIAFEFCAHSLGAQRHLHSGTRLAHLILPRVEVTITGSEATVHGATAAEVELIEDLLGRPAGPLPAAHPADVRADPSDYRARVAAAVGEIASGRYQKVILSRRVELPFRVDLPASYRLGRAHNTPARSFLFRLGGLAAAGFSPELVAAVDDRGVVTTEPLAGTRAFGHGAATDLAARHSLESDPKEIVEHAVSVKTSFAEIASIAEPGTTAVADFMAVRERGSVQHLASTVRGRLARHRTPWDALEALFPSVTASGIPKQAGVDAVFRHDSARGLYSGAVVMLSGTGAMEATLVLRAVYQDDDTAWLRAGAGIIAQSTPEREFEETCEKLSSVAPYLVSDHRRQHGA